MEILSSEEATPLIQTSDATEAFSSAGDAHIVPSAPPKKVGQLTIQSNALPEDSRSLKDLASLEDWRKKTSWLELGLPQELIQSLTHHTMSRPKAVQCIISICAREKISGIICGPQGLTKASGAIITAIDVAMSDVPTDDSKTLSAVIVTSTAELVRQMAAEMKSILIGDKSLRSSRPIRLLAVPNVRTNTSEVAETAFDILVCTPKPLATMLANAKFSAQCPRLLIFDQGMTLASNEHQREISDILAWAHSQIVIDGSIGSATIIVLSQILDLKLDLHTRLHNLYTKRFLRSKPSIFFDAKPVLLSKEIDALLDKHSVTVAFDTNPLLFFKGKGVLLECQYPVEARYRAFVDQIVDQHQGIICVDYSMDRLKNLSALCSKDDHKSEVLDTKSPREARLTLERFRDQSIRLLLTDFAGLDGVKCAHADAVVIFASPSRSSENRGGKFKTRVDFLRDAIETVRLHGEKARVYFFYAPGTDIHIKNAIAQVLQEMGSEVPETLQQNLRGPYMR